MDLQMRKSKLETERDDALAAAAPRVAAKAGRASQHGEGEGGMDLKVRKSKLELEKEAWKAAEAAQVNVAVGAHSTACTFCGG